MPEDDKIFFFEIQGKIEAENEADAHDRLYNLLAYECEFTIKITGEED